MLKRNIYLMLLLEAFLSCSTKSDKTIHYPATARIDSAEFKKLIDKFDLFDMVAASENLGGLNPNYPIAIAVQKCQSTPDTDWVTGGFICVVLKPIIKQEDKYIVINNKAELRKIYAPITTPQEALAYATLFSKAFPVLDKRFFKKKYEYYNNYKPSVSYAVKNNAGYEVKLFSYKDFGCGHPYSEVIFQVYTNGDVKKIREVKAFEDPEEKSLCVD